MKSKHRSPTTCTSWLSLCRLLLKLDCLRQTALGIGQGLFLATRAAEKHRLATDHDFDRRAHRAQSILAENDAELRPSLPSDRLRRVWRVRPECRLPCPRRIPRRARWRTFRALGAGFGRVVRRRAGTHGRDAGLLRLGTAPAEIDRSRGRVESRLGVDQKRARGDDPLIRLQPRQHRIDDFSAGPRHSRAEFNAHALERARCRLAIDNRLRGVDDRDFRAGQARGLRPTSTPPRHPGRRPTPTPADSWAALST